MNPRVKEVYPIEDYQLRLIFNNGEEKIFDVKPYLNIGVFKELKNPAIFETVHPFLGSIIWGDSIDLCPDTLYMESKKIN